VMTGTPMTLKATGAVLATRQRSAASIGSNPSETSIATAAPNQSAAPKNPPNANAISTA
jgi:hypothetical protein